MSFQDQGFFCEGLIQIPVFISGCKYMYMFVHIHPDLNIHPDKRSSGPTHILIQIYPDPHSSRYIRVDTHPDPH